jgi:anti-sigma regulatory factor (Ser/Thr protein kinase)
MPARTGRAFQHDAFLYASDEELVEAMVPFVRDGMTRGHATVAVTPACNLALLRDGLGPDADQVRFVDAAAWYTTPAASIAGFDAVMRDLTDRGFTQVRAVGEIPFGNLARERASWTRYEAIVNAVLERLPLWVICLYDVRALPGGLVADMRRTHPAVWEAGGRGTSRRYVEPAALLRDLPEERPAPTGQPSLRLVASGDPHGWRHPVAAALAGSGLPPARVEEFLVAVSEVVANARQHGAGSPLLTLWSDAGGTVCEVDDDGGGLDDPLAGYRPPGSDASWGMGLWVARQLCDAVVIRSGPNRTTVRLAISH